MYIGAYRRGSRIFCRGGGVAIVKKFVEKNIWWSRAGGGGHDPPPPPHTHTPLDPRLAYISVVMVGSPDSILISHIYRGVRRTGAGCVYSKTQLMI